MKTLRVLFESTSSGPVRIDREQVKDCLIHVNWQSLTPAQIASFLIKNIRPWRVDPSSIPKGTIDVPPLVMPHIFFFKLSSSSVIGDELVLSFSGPFIKNFNPYDKFYYERRDWDGTQETACDSEDVLRSNVHLLPSTDTCTADQWLTALVNGTYRNLIREGTLTYDETEQRMNMVWDIICWDFHEFGVEWTNEETFKAVSTFYGFTPPEEGYHALDPEDWDEFYVALEQHWSDFWDAFNKQLQTNRHYAMAILTHPLKRAKPSLKRKADGSHTTQSLPELPHLPLNIRKLVDAYVYT